MNKTPKYQIIQKNSGPFAMWQVCLARKVGKLMAGTVIKTFSDEGEAHMWVQGALADEAAQ